MSHFYGNMRGSRGEATRCGTKASGMLAHIRGWNIGAMVKCYEESGKDYVSVTITKGSSGQGTGLHLGTFVETPDGIVVKK